MLMMTKQPIWAKILPCANIFNHLFILLFNLIWVNPTSSVFISAPHMFCYMQYFFYMFIFLKKKLYS